MVLDVLRGLPDRHRPHQPVLPDQGRANYTGYSDPDVDRLTNEARQTVDDAAREALLAQVEQRIGEQAVHVFLMSVNWLMGVDQERVQNFHYSGVYGPYYDRLWVSA